MNKDGGEVGAVLVTHLLINGDDQVLCCSRHSVHDQVRDLSTMMMDDRSTGMAAQVDDLITFFVRT